VHPALTNPVVWIPGRADILLAIFCLGGFILFLHFLRDRSPLAYFGHMLFFALALLCRENALALPAVCLSYILFIAREKPFSFNQRLLGSGWLAIVFLWVFLRRAILVNPLEVGVVDAVRSVWKAAPAVIQYLGKAIFPFNLSVLPVIKDTGFIWGVLAVILILFGLLLSKKKRPRIVLFGAAWYLLFLAPCFIRPYTRSVDSFLEHRAYASFLGLFIVLLETDFVKALNLIKGPARLIAGCVLLMALSGIAFFYSGNYKDRMSFWQSAVKTSPHSPLAHRNLGAMYHLDGKLERAEEEYKEALRINPYEPMANNNLGLIFMKKGQVAQAEQAFLKELSFNPDYDDANYNIGLLYYQLDRKDEAVRLWEKTVRINPNHKQALECLGKI
jgi:hypothetical protein